MSTFRFLLTNAGKYVVVLISIAGLIGHSLSAMAADLPASEMQIGSDQDGRFELFALGANNSLYNRWELAQFAVPAGVTPPSPCQSASPSNWSTWVPNLTESGTHLVVVRSEATQELYAASIDKGQIAIRHQHGGNGAWTDAVVDLGKNLTSLALAQDGSGRLIAFSVGNDGTLYEIAETHSGSHQWGTSQQLYLRALDGGSTLSTGKLAAFDVPTNPIASVRMPNGLVSVFVIRRGGALTSISEDGPDGKVDIQQDMGLGGVTALSTVSSAGQVTVFALTANDQLKSRTQGSDGQWGAWQDVLSDVDTWTAITDGLGGALLFANSGAHLMAVHMKPGGFWQTQSVVLDPSAQCAALPFRSLSVVAGQQQIMLAAVDAKGEIFVRDMAEVDDPSLIVGIKDITGWVWLGGVSVSPNAPDFVAQLGTCLTGTLEALLEKAITSQLSTSISDPVLGALAQHASVAARCDSLPNNQGFRETLGIWLDSQPFASQFPGEIRVAVKGRAPEMLALEVTPAGLRHVIDAEWASFPKRYDDSGNASPTGAVALDTDAVTLQHNLLAIRAQGSFAAVRTHIPFTIDIKAHFLAENSRPVCQATLTLTAPQAQSGLGEALTSLGVPLFGALLGEAKAQDLLNQVAAQFNHETQMVCTASQAFPTSVFLGPMVIMGQANTLAKIVFSYDHSSTEKASGITLYGAALPLPQALAPSISVDQEPGSGVFLDANKTLFAVDVIPTSSDMFSPQFTWQLSWPKARWQAIPGKQAVELIFPGAPTNLNVGTTLGTITLTATDQEDGVAQKASRTIPLTLTTAALAHVIHGEDTKPPKPLMNKQ